MDNWQPIETAPKDARILLGFQTQVFIGIFTICGYWEGDRYASKPKPYWSHDMEKLRGVRETRAQQPTHWMPLPKAPE